MQCTKCGGRSTLYLCKLCITELRKQLLRLPTMCDHLNDVVTGQTRLGENQRGPVGFGPSSPPLSNGSAAALLTQIDDTVGQWARSLSRSHSFIISPPVNWHRPISKYRHTTRDYAMFLASHVTDLAADPDIGELVAALRSYVRRSVNLVNRRVPPQFCGPCPTLITEHSRCEHPPEGSCVYRQHECATRLMAKRGAVEVRCDFCGVTHRVEGLINHLLARADVYRGTISEVYRVLRMLGTPVKIRTLYHWADPKVGRLRPAGYLREDGRRIAPTRHSDKDKPVYRVSEARKAAENHNPGRGNHIRTEQTKEKTRASVAKTTKSEGNQQK